MNTEGSEFNDRQDITALDNNKFANDGSFLELFKKLKREKSLDNCQRDDKNVPSKNFQVSLLF